MFKVDIPQKQVFGNSNTCLDVVADRVIVTQVDFANLGNVHLISNYGPQTSTEGKHEVSWLNGDAFNRTDNVIPAQVITQDANYVSEAHIAADLGPC